MEKKTIIQKRNGKNGAFIAIKVGVIQSTEDFHRTKEKIYSYFQITVMSYLA